MKQWFINFFCVAVLSSQLFAQTKQPVDYVDPKIGTAQPNSRWMMFPGATTPFGMVALSPDNLDMTGWIKGGFDPKQKNIAGFSHIHAWTMSGLQVMPTTGKLEVKPKRDDVSGNSYRSRFSNDVASPGYYSVFLDDYNIKAELTATTRTGFHKYTFPKSDSSHILFDLKFPSEYNFDLINARLKKVSDTEIVGFSRQLEKYYSGPWQEYTLHFVIKFDKPFKSFGFWNDEQSRLDTDYQECIKDADIGAFANFTTTEGEVIQVKIGFSLVSIEQARLNLDTETAPFGWNFDKAKNQAHETWNNLLSKVEVQGTNETDKIKFYTNFYRSFCSRATLSDVNGQYKDMCEQTNQLKNPNSPVYGCDAFWNTFWNLNQLWCLITPEYANQWVNSQLEMCDKGGWLCKGPAGFEYSNIMEAEHEIALIVGAYQKGIRNFDIEKAYEAMKKMQTVKGQNHGCGGVVGNFDLPEYMQLGYVPFEVGSISHTLEYAYDDWCVAQMAKALGKTEDYEYFMKRSQNYRHIFDPSVGYMRPKSKDGNWVKDFDPYSDGKRRINIDDDITCNPYSDFVEGNSWQYTFFVPHDMFGLIKLIGKDSFNNRLLEGFQESKEFRYSHWKYVAHGNQPNMQAAYLFNYSGMPWETQNYAREILNVYYGSKPEDGYPGDEDEGQGGSWFVMSAMGMFEMDGGVSTKPIYELGSPLFNKITLHLDKNYYSGNDFVIEAINNSNKNRYIQSATLNGKPLNVPWFYHSELVKGGSLKLIMGSKPNKKWGSSENAMNVE
jgi:predicted alpha-1,2-mannosidase